MDPIWKFLGGLLGIVALIVVLLALGVCSLGDEDGWAPVQVAGHYDHDESERNGRNGNDCNQSENCSDDDKVDFRPVVCVQPGSCQFGPDPQPT